VFYFEGIRQPKLYGKTKTEIQNKISKKLNELSRGIITDDSYTVADAIQDWLKDGLPGRAPRTINNYSNVLKPVVAIIGDRPLVRLIGDDIRLALNAYAASRRVCDPRSDDPFGGRSQSTVTRAHVCLKNAIRFAKSRGLIDRNVAQDIDTPEGQNDGRENRSFSLHQVVGILQTCQGMWLMDAYVHLGLLHSTRPEELRALRRENVDDLDTPGAGFDIVRSVRRKGQLKNRTSRRGHELHPLAIDALKRHYAIQAECQLRAGELWDDSGLVFTDKLGRGPLSDTYMRRQFRKMLAEVPDEYDIDPDEWTPYELRHTFASLLSEYGGLTVEMIAKEMGHSTTSTTQTVYIKQLKPRRTEGARAMDRVLKLASEK
jgi:integrase